MANQALIVIAVVVVFGIFVPVLKGFLFLDPLLLFVYCWIGVVFAIPASAEAFAQNQERGGMVLKKTAVILAYGWGVSALLLLSGIVTVNLANWHGSLLAPPAKFLISGLLMSAGACFAFIALSAVIAKSRGAQSTKTLFRAGLIIALLALFFLYQFAPQSWRIALDQNLTTAALTRFAFVAAAVLAIMGGALTAITARSVARGR